MVVAAGCSDSGTEPDSGSSSVTSVGTSDAIAGSAPESAVAVTTTTLVEARYRPFVDAWNSVYETGSIARIRQAVNPESLNLYGEEACVAYVQSQTPIPDGFRVILPEVSAQGLTQVELDGVRVAVYLDSPVILEWPGGRFAPQWAPDWVPYPASEHRSQYRDLALVDCGEPLEGRMPLVLAAHESDQDSGASTEAVLSFDAPDHWWIEIAAPSRGTQCHIALVEAASGETELTYTAYEATAAEVTIGGSLQIVASGNCPRITAVTDESLLSTPVSDLVASPASIWMPHIYSDGEVGAGESIVIVNSGELPGDMTGWTLEGVTFSLEFPEGFTIGPKQEVLVHARCGADTDTELHLCLEGGTLTSHEMTLYNEDGAVMDGFS
jgi:hypothetical protein